MRDQILSSFNHRDFSIMVVGNKFDLVADTNLHSQVKALYAEFQSDHTWKIYYTLRVFDGVNQRFEC